MAVQKNVWSWSTPRLPEPVRVARWGHFGIPVLVFPSAAADCEEVERFGLLAALEELIAASRIKLYSVDSVAARHWLQGSEPPEYCARVQNLFDAFVYEELVPHIRHDCRDERLEIVVAGAAVGAFNAVASLCRHPDVFRIGIGLSGLYDLAPYARGCVTQDLYFASPLRYLPGLGESLQLAELRRRHIVLASGRGDYEQPAETWRLAELLRSKGISHQVEIWDESYHYDWSTWRAMLAKYLDEHS